MRMENLHVETRERISNGVVCARNVLCRYSKVMCSSCEEQTAEEGHDVRAVGGAGCHALHHSLVVCRTGGGCGGWTSCGPRQQLPAQWGTAPSIECCAAAVPGSTAH